MAEQRILDRLAKLMELASRGDEHEAEVAAERAAELMAKHQLSVLDLQSPTDVPRVERGRVDAEEGAMPSRVEKWEKVLFAAVVDSVGGRPWITGRGKLYTFHMVGPVDSVATARYLYLMLEKQVNRASRAAARERVESNAWRRGHAFGMCVRIHERLRAGRASAMKTASTTAMVLVDRTKAAMDEEMKNLNLRAVKTKALKRPDAISTGYDEGGTVDLGGNEGAARLGVGQKRLR